MGGNSQPSSFHYTAVGKVDKYEISIEWADKFPETETLAFLFGAIQRATDILRNPKCKSVKITKVGS